MGGVTRVCRQFVPRRASDFWSGISVTAKATLEDTYSLPYARKGFAAAVLAACGLYGCLPPSPLKICTEISTSGIPKLNLFFPLCPFPAPKSL